MKTVCTSFTRHKLRDGLPPLATSAENGFNASAKSKPAPVIADDDGVAAAAVADDFVEVGVGATIGPGAAPAAVGLTPPAAGVPLAVGGSASATH